MDVRCRIDPSGLLFCLTIVNSLDLRSLHVVLNVGGQLFDHHHTHDCVAVLNGSSCYYAAQKRCRSPHLLLTSASRVYSPSHELHTRQLVLIPRHEHDRQRYRALAPPYQISYHLTPTDPAIFRSLL